MHFVLRTQNCFAIVRSSRSTNLSRRTISRKQSFAYRSTKATGACPPAMKTPAFPTGIRNSPICAFKAEFGDAPPGWQYHHIVNQNHANEANPNVGPLLHTTENVVLIPTWWHYIISSIYSTKDKNLGMTIREWQGKYGYAEQL